MAGSYKHCRADGGAFSFDLIENMGDAHEACEMMFWMIYVLAGGSEQRISDAQEIYFKMERGEMQWPVEPHNVSEN